MSKFEEEIEKLLAEDSFVAWIEGTASEQETAKWEAWLENDPARKKLVEKAQSFLRSFDSKKKQRPEVEAELLKLKEAVVRFEESEEGSRETRIFQINHKVNYSSVAAIILLLVTVLSIATLSDRSNFFQSDSTEKSNPKFITESTDNGQQKVLTLSDGSTITLNANSSLKYPLHYAGDDLEVWLEGEAYFDIVHKTGSETRSFFVNVPGGAVEVLGTKFNVNTYEQATEVVLVEGRVDVQMKDTSNQIKDSYVMQPGELTRISQLDENITTRKVESEMYTAWTQDKLIFERTPLAKVAERIEHIYNVQFQLNTDELKETRVSGSLPNNDLDVFLNTLENMLNRPVTNRGSLIILGEQRSDKINNR